MVGRGTRGLVVGALVVALLAVPGAAFAQSDASSYGQGPGATNVAPSTAAQGQGPGVNGVVQSAVPQVARGTTAQPQVVARALPNTGGQGSVVDISTVGLAGALIALLAFVGARGSRREPTRANIGG